MDVKEVPPFPNPGVRLIKEDDRIAIFEEIFDLASRPRHTGIHATTSPFSRRREN